MSILNYRNLLKSNETESRFDRLWKYGTAGVVLFNYGRNKYRKFQDDREYTVVVDDSTHLYNRLSLYLTGKAGVQETKLVSVFMFRGKMGSEFISDDPIIVDFDGHDIEVETSSERKKKGGQPQSSDDILTVYTGGPQKKIHLTAKDKAGKEAVLKVLKTLCEKDDDEESNEVVTLSQYGDWGGYYPLPYRPYKSVVLAEGQMERISEDLQLFLNSQKQYEELGIPWHRGYLLHGPPGSGKTSVAKCLAYEFGMDLFYIPLSSLKNDVNLANLIARIPAKSILLLEDVDIVHATKERDDAQQGITLSGLLNALDGVLTPPGIVTIMTTNNKDVLDDALIRAGRIDLDEEITYLTVEQLNRLVFNFTGKDLNLSLGDDKITASEVVEMIKCNLHDQAAVEASFKERFA